MNGNLVLRLGQVDREAPTLVASISTIDQGFLGQIVWIQRSLE
jgi:hypothetical protein